MLECRLRRYGQVRIVGFENTHQITSDLDRGFVPLYVHADNERRGQGKGRPGKADDIGELAGDVTIEDSLALAGESRGRRRDGARLPPRPRLAFIGDPGAGKTTLLHYLYNRAATGQTGGVPELAGLVPVMIRLFDLAADRRCERGLARAVERLARAASYPEAGPALLRAPTAGPAVPPRRTRRVRNEPTRHASATGSTARSTTGRAAAS